MILSAAALVLKCDYTTRVHTKHPLLGKYHAIKMTLLKMINLSLQLFREKKIPQDSILT